VTGVRGGIAILVDPGVRGVGIDPAALIDALRRVGIGRATLVPGLARHPELLTAAVKVSGAHRAVVVTEDFEHPPIAELRTWGVAGGLAPLGVQVVALDILRARRSTTERLAYAVRLVRAAVAALDTPGTARAGRRAVGASMSRRALLSARATTWVPVVEVDPRSCLGTLRCQRCLAACPVNALHIRDDVPSAAPVVDTNLCEACSRCLDVCPTGAIRLDGHDPGSLSGRLRALLHTGDGAAVPALVLACRSAAEPVHRLGTRGGLPGWLVLEVGCLGGLGSAWHLAALAAGARTVQVLPCASCRDEGSLSAHVSFTRKTLGALGDPEASRRVGILPRGRVPLRRALLDAGGLTALVDGTGSDRIPLPDPSGTSGPSSPTWVLQTSAPVAAWAVRELRQALGGPVQDPDGRRVVIHGEAAPLGVLRAAEGCTGCGVCVRDCPTRALSLSAGLGWTDLVLDPAACTGCGVCVQTCPERALDVVAGIHLDLLARGRAPISRAARVGCLDCGESIPALPADSPLTTLPAGLTGRCPRCRQAALVATMGD